jgi:hypothetical protein
MEAITLSLPPHALIGTRARLLALRANRHARLAGARASLDVDGEDAFEPLHPTHGCHGLVAFHRALRSLRHDAFTMLEIGRKDTRDGFAPLLLTLRVRRAVALACAVETRQIHAWAWNQCRQAGDKIQRFQHDMGSASKANGAVFAQRKKRGSHADQRVPSRKGCL